MKHDWNVGLNTDHLAVNGSHKNKHYYWLFWPGSSWGNNVRELTVIILLDWVWNIWDEDLHINCYYSWICQVISYRNILCSDEYVEEGCL